MGESFVDLEGSVRQDLSLLERGLLVGTIWSSLPCSTNTGTVMALRSEVDMKLQPVNIS